ncbi:hypothetical protein F1880_010091 [Penicillium rolfsii]|nr:hypothetical protein F1880_010091 [Penicillium rolfsii]
MSAPITRRNRAPASCEPCRERKTRCDHKKPVCASCQRRGLDSRCYYHPAPLTKNPTGNRLTVPTLPRSSHAAPPWSRNSSKGRQSHISRSAAGAPKFHTWPFMSSVSSDALPQTPTPGSHGSKAYNAHLATMREIVAQLKYFPTIEKSIHRYYSFKQNALVPKPVVLRLLEMVRADFVSSGNLLGETEERIDLSNVSEVSEAVLHSSSTEVLITPTLDLHGFLSLFCGTNLRVETLGLFYTMAARASFFFVDQDEDKDDLFVQDMVWYSKLSLQLARDLAPQSTDLIIWLANENAQLLSFLEGDASLAVWRLVGDLATDLLALGLNREETYSLEKTPFFLAECRRRCFVTEYYLEKMFGLIFHLPPRITAKYVDVKLPLDLSDEELFAERPEELEASKSRLTEDGWNTDGKYRAATWARLRYILSQFREELIEYQFQASQAADFSKLRDLSFRCSQTWDNLLPHLQYSQQCWNSDIPLTVCYMHAKVHLAYLQVHFQIYLILGEDNSSPIPELLNVSANILETVVQLGNSRNKSAFTFNDLPEILLSCGLSSAAALLAALENLAQDPLKSLPPGIKASAIIRNISVLASQLENSASPRERNQTFCLQAAKAITEKLDKILDKFATTNPLASTEITTSTDISPISVLTPNAGCSGDFGEIEAINLEDYENFDLLSWAINVDNENLASNWTVI